MQRLVSLWNKSLSRLRKILQNWIEIPRAETKVWGFVSLRDKSLSLLREVLSQDLDLSTWVLDQISGLPMKGSQDNGHGFFGLCSAYFCVLGCRFYLSPPISPMWKKGQFFKFTFAFISLCLWDFVWALNGVQWNRKRRKVEEHRLSGRGWCSCFPKESSFNSLTNIFSQRKVFVHVTKSTSTFQSRFGQILEMT